MQVILQKDNTVALKSHIAVYSEQHGLGQLNLVKVSFIWEVQQTALFCSYFFDLEEGPGVEVKHSWKFSLSGTRELSIKLTSITNINPHNNYCSQRKSVIY